MRERKKKRKEDDAETGDLCVRMKSSKEKRINQKCLGLNTLIVTCQSVAECVVLN